LVLSSLTLAKTTCSESPFGRQEEQQATADTTGDVLCALGKSLLVVKLDGQRHPSTPADRAVFG